MHTAYECRQLYKCLQRPSFAIGNCGNAFWSVRGFAVDTADFACVLCLYSPLRIFDIFQGRFPDFADSIHDCAGSYDHDFAHDIGDASLVSLRG